MKYPAMFLYALYFHIFPKYEEIITFIHKMAVRALYALTAVYIESCKGNT